MHQYTQQKHGFIVTFHSNEHTSIQLIKEKKIRTVYEKQKKNSISVFFCEKKPIITFSHTIQYVEEHRNRVKNILT